MNQDVAESFVRAWQSSDSRTEVSKKLNVGISTVDYRRGELIKMGVNLKKMPRKMPRRNPQLNIDRLNWLIEEKR